MANIDLKLLRILNVLLEVKNTTKAGEILYMTQPNISKALAKLREHFNDPLFLRQSHGLMPTAKANEIGQKLPQLLNQLDLLVNDKARFKPQDIKGKITIAANPFIFAWLGKSLAQIILKEAPDIELHLTHWNEDSEVGLLRGNIDIGINYVSPTISKQIHQQRVGIDDFCFVLRKEHPHLDGMITPKDFYDYPIASLIIPHWNVRHSNLEETLSHHIKRVKTSFRSTDLAVILDMVENSNMIFPCSTVLAKTLDVHRFKRCLPSKEIVKPDSSVVVLADKVRREDNVIKWLTEQIKQHPQVRAETQ